MRLLIIGSLGGQLGDACTIAQRLGAKVMQAETVESGLDTLRSGAGAATNLVMIDVSLDVADLIGHLTEERIAVPVVACGVGNNTQAAVRAIKAGAKEYLPLPPDAELIGAVLTAVTGESHHIVGQDPALKQVMALAERVAPSPANVLITGESGTGKELLARFIHRKSSRVDRPFISVNCAAIPENLLESELFGYEKGAFTGAVARRIGKFEAAHGGSLLLDELGELDPRMQAKLLRVLQEREIDRLGGTRPIKVDIRLIATTNRDLQEEVRRGNFREDLYFRVNVVTLRLPSLRERPADIAPLAIHFIRKYSDINGVPGRALSAIARQRIEAHDWPGNIRELENTIHRAVLLANGTEIGPEAVMLASDGSALPMTPRAAGDAMGAERATSGAGGGLVGRTVATVERDLIIDTLRHCLGNRTQAATILGISIRTLRNKLRQYTDEGLSVPEPRGAEARVSAL